MQGIGGRREGVQGIGGAGGSGVRDKVPDSQSQVSSNKMVSFITGWL